MLVLSAAVLVLVRVRVREWGVAAHAHAHEDEDEDEDEDEGEDEGEHGATKSLFERFAPSVIDLPSSLVLPTGESACADARSSLVKIGAWQWI